MVPSRGRAGNNKRSRRFLPRRQDLSTGLRGLVDPGLDRRNTPGAPSPTRQGNKVDSADVARRSEADVSVTSGALFSAAFSDRGVPGTRNARRARADLSQGASRRSDYIARRWLDLKFALATEVSTSRPPSLLGSGCSLHATIQGCTAAQFFPTKARRASDDVAIAWRAARGPTRSEPEAPRGAFPRGDPSTTRTRARQISRFSPPARSPITRRVTARFPEPSGPNSLHNQATSVKRVTLDTT